MDVSFDRDFWPYLQLFKFKIFTRNIFQALLERDMSWVEVQFLRSAVDVLRKSRQCLMFTYVFAFYLKKTNNAEIFEHNQVLKILLE